MSKLSQLERFKRLHLPTPKFVGVAWSEMEVKTFREKAANLNFPLAVRSSFDAEDGLEHSHAGEFDTQLNVRRLYLETSLKAVFASYPNPEGQEVIMQEMVEAEYSGVLFAFRRSMWKTELVQGPGEGLVSGRITPQRLLLPRFNTSDRLWSQVLPIWNPFAKLKKQQHLRGPLIHLSVTASKLLRDFTEEEAPHGLDIEFSIARNKLYLLQARPITTPDEGEEVLTSANHKEILPPQPSAFMTGLIASCSHHLFAYYRRLDSSLDSRNFIEVSEGMPWINLSALLDTMVAWGLPTSLVSDSVGARDVYRVGFRPWKAVRKWPIFFRVLKEQFRVAGRTRRWVRATNWLLIQEVEARRLMWRNNPEIAYNNWLTNLQVIYTDLVGLMQALTGAMSVPMRIMARLGILQRFTSQSESGQYLQDFQALRSGEMDRALFLKQHGHRGFYESDIGNRRFWEYAESEWDVLMDAGAAPVLAGTRKIPALFDYLLRPFNRLIRTREWLRSQTMRFFFVLREEMMEQFEARFGKEVDFSRLSPEDLHRAFELNDPEFVKSIHYDTPSGWNTDTFLCNRLGRRTSISSLINIQQSEAEAENRGLGIYPGKVRGQVWRVSGADMQLVKRPPFTSTILVTESLDPGWVPFFVQANAVLSYVGGLLSHASILLRESRIPSITQVPRGLVLKTGDWVEIDGRTGEIHLLAKP